IRVVIRQGVVYFCAIVTSTALFVLTAELLRRLAGYDEDRVPLLEASVVAIALAIFFQPLKTAIQRWFNEYLYRQTYDYQKTVREASRKLSTMLELDELLEYLTGAIEMTFKTESVAIYFRRPSEIIFTCTTKRGEQSRSMARMNAALSETSALVT